jgi:hypothetical protein
METKLEELLRKRCLRYMDMTLVDYLDKSNTCISTEEKKFLKNFFDDSETFWNQILKAYKRKLYREIQQQKKIKEKNKDFLLKNKKKGNITAKIFYNEAQKKQKELEKKVKSINLEKIKKIFDKTEETFYDNILKLFFDDYINPPKYKVNLKNNILKEKYKWIEDGLEYKKYMLLELNTYRKLVKKRFYYLSDERDKNLNICLDEEISDEVCAFFLELKEKGFVGKLSIRPHYYRLLKDFIPSEEEKEFGKYFEFKNLKESFVTKLYDYKSNDILWINIKNKNITFEEILDDFEILDDEIIKTKVLHCEYFKDNEKFYISHLDYEYIYYSIDEFEKRKNSVNQKGNKEKRTKIFKIDNSKIPIILDNGVNVLMFFLNQYFQQKELIKEYFQNI